MNPCRLSATAGDGPDGGMPRRSRFFQAFGLRQLPDSGEGPGYPEIHGALSALDIVSKPDEANVLGHCPARLLAAT